MLTHRFPLTLGVGSKGHKSTFSARSCCISVAYDNHCLCVHKKVSHLPSQLGIFVFTFTVKRFHIYGALLHLALKVFTLLHFHI